MTIKTSTREQYAKRLDKVVMYLADHLDAELDIHRLAEEAHLSPYHFHRVYAAMVGETVAETVKRLRLHRSALELITTAAPVAKLAAEAGYASVQSFTRVFRDAYGLPPAAYRRRGEQLDIAAGIARGLHPSQRKPEPDMYPVKIQEIPPQRVAAMEYRGDYTQIGPTFERLSLWAAGKGLMAPTSRSYGIYYDDPASMPVDKLRADACVTVPEGTRVDGDVKLTQTPSGRCAEIIHVGPYSELHRAYDWFYREWLPRSGEAPGDQPCFEEYLNDPRHVAPSKLETAIRIPLR
jgi:AraC family transcriptional regulator